MKSKNRLESSGHGACAFLVFWAMALTFRVHAADAPQPSDLDLSTPEKSITAFADAIDKHDMDAVLRCSAHEHGSKEILEALVELSCVTDDADKAIKTAFGRSVFLHHNTPVLNEIDAYHRAGGAKIDGNDASFTNPVNQTVQISLKRIDNKWYVRPASVFNHQIVEELPEMAVDMAVARDLADGIRKGRYPSLEDAQKGAAKVRQREFAAMVAKWPPLPKPDLSSPKRAMVEVYVTGNIGDLARLEQVTWPTPCSRELFDACRTLDAAMEPLNKAIAEKFPDEIPLRPNFITFPAAVRGLAVSRWQELVRKAQAWSEGFDLVVDGETAKATPKNLKSFEKSLVLHRDADSWKVEKPYEQSELARYQQIHRVANDMTPQCNRLANDVRGGKFASFEVVQQAFYQMEMKVLTAQREATSIPSTSPSPKKN